MEIEIVRHSQEWLCYTRRKRRCRAGDDGPLRKAGPTKSRLEAGGTKWAVGAGGRLGGEDFAGEEDDGSADEAGDAEEPEAVHEAEEGGLLEDDAGELG